MVDVEKLTLVNDEMFPVVNTKLEIPNIITDLLQSIKDELVETHALENVYEILWIELCSSVRNQIVPKFWSHFKLDSNCLNLLNSSYSSTLSTSANQLQYQLFQKFVVAVQNIENDFNVLKELLQQIHAIQYSSGIKTISGRPFDLKRLHEILRESMLGQLCANFKHIINAFYYVSFRVFNNLNRSADTDIDMTPLNDIICGGCNLEEDKCSCKYLIALISHINERLLHMELLDSIAGQTMTSLVQNRIKEYINDTCQGSFDKSHLKRLQMWLDNIVISWLTHVFRHENMEIEENNATTMNIIQGFKVKLTYFLFEHFAHSAIDQFFSIIIDFPDSIPAIDDLKICMEKIDIRKHLIKTLKSSLEARILHPGVNTMDILTGYVAAIKAIRHLDSSGVILETVTSPIKEYLRKRSDTVRRVVTGLTEEGPTDLSEELAKGETFKENINSTISDELSNWENWNPDPFGLEESNYTKCANLSRSADIISMVVDIYGSKELFMNEYRNLMAERLLTQLDFNPEKEIRNLELLKLRFGETLLHSCEVMLKDVADSKRINGHIQSDSKNSDHKLFDISSLIISAQFWPPFNKESLELPESIANEFKKYTKSYEAYKGNRTLNWRNVTGRVNITIELGERTIDMTVPPTQAVIIYYFQHKSEWSLDELSSLLKVPSTVLRRRIGFWQAHGLISEIRDDIYKLNEDQVHKSKLNEIRNAVADDADIESAMASASDQREEELQVFWSYIVGMLTNLDSLPIERIHQMLKLFASHGIGVEFSQEELKDFLQRKVREHKLIFSGGVYQLTK